MAITVRISTSRKAGAADGWSPTWTGGIHGHAGWVEEYIGMGGGRLAGGENRGQDTDQSSSAALHSRTSTAGAAVSSRTASMDTTANRPMHTVRTAMTAGVGRAMGRRRNAARVVSISSRAASSADIRRASSFGSAASARRNARAQRWSCWAVWVFMAPSRSVCAATAGSQRCASCTAAQVDGARSASASGAWARPWGISTDLGQLT